MRFQALIVTAIAMAQLAFGEHLGRRCVDLVGDVAVAEVGDRLGERQRGSLAFGEQVAGLFQRVQQREALLGLARAWGVVGVHVEAERAVVHLRGADLYQVSEPDRCPWTRQC